MTEVRRIQILSIYIALFVLVQSVFIWNGGTFGVFNSPDANANYYFSLQIFQGKPLGMQLPDAPNEARQFLFTRSTHIVGDTVLPVGFLGLIMIYGSISKLLFINLIPYLTVFASAAGIFFFYHLMKYFFSSDAAFASALALGLHPAWWYYTNDSLLPNVLFMSLAIISFTAVLRALTNNSIRMALIAGIVSVLAIWVRMSEALWFIPLLILFSYMVPEHPKEVRRTFSIYWLTVLAGALCAWMVQRGLTQTSHLFGYVVPGDAAKNGGGLLSLLFPFGFHPRLIALHAYQYGLRIFWLYTLATAVSLWISGLAVYVRSRLAKIYFAAAAVCSAVVLILYGSWQVTDALSPWAITIGTSYVRYFLPVYTFVCIPLIANGAVKGLQYVSKKYRFSVLVMLVGIGIVSLYATTMAGFPESIIAKAETVKSYDTIAGWVLEHTSEDSIILTAKGDKYLWPKRNVITSFSTQQGLQAALIFQKQGHPLYYSGVTFDQKKLDEFNTKLQAVGLLLGLPLYTYADVSIYPITPLQPHAP